MRGNKFLKI